MLKRVNRIFWFDAALYFYLQTKTNMKQIIFLFLFLFSFISNAQQKHLAGVVTRDSLNKAPFNTWFQSNYDAYTPHQKFLDAIPSQAVSSTQIEIFFGTWCGDTKREMPRFFKILDQLKFQAKQIKLIAVNSDENYKQSPGGETIGKSIYRVPTFIFYQQGKEIGRIVEHPVESLEADFAKILTKQTYTPSYPAFVLLDKWHKEGKLTDPNQSARSLARAIDGTVISSSELNNFGYVMQAQKQFAVAEMCFRMAANLFSDQPDSWSRLANAYLLNGKLKEAEEAIHYALSFPIKPDEIYEFLDVYYKIRKKKEEKETNR
jgi:thiol-disulfide isomerase/thioredoxin